MNSMLEKELSDKNLETNSVSNIDDTFDDLIESDKQYQDVKDFFAIANENVRAATEIFNKSVAMKNRLLEQAEVVKRQRAEHEKKTAYEIEKIKQYREELKAKFNTKKQELDALKNSLHAKEVSLNGEKLKFEKEKRQQREFIERKEAKLREEKEALEKEREQLVQDKVKYNEDAKELENNLKRFNELVSNFTNGMEKFNEE